MPWKARINAAFPFLFKSLGITAPVGSNPQFELVSLVTPVAIVSNEGPAISTIIDTQIGTGRGIAPADTTILANTGPMQAGLYNFVFSVGTNDTAIGGGFNIQRQDVALATVWVQFFGGVSWFYLNARFRANEGDRFLIVKDGIPTAGMLMSAAIYTSPV